MSAEYWLASQAVPFFTQRLSERHNVSPLHGARMFQLLFAGGWEPTKIHYSLIPEAVWRVHEREAVARTIQPITFELLPLMTRLPDKQSIPGCPEDSMIPVLFHTGSQSFVVPLVCEPDERQNGGYFLAISFDHTNEESPYIKPGSSYFGDEYECGGDAFWEYLLPSLSPEVEETDFDAALREYLFDQLSGKAVMLGSESFYRAWAPYLADLERSSQDEEDYRAAIQRLRAAVLKEGGEEAQIQFNNELPRLLQEWANHPQYVPQTYERIIEQMQSLAHRILRSPQRERFQQMPAHSSV